MKKIVLVLALLFVSGCKGGGSGGTGSFNLNVSSDPANARLFDHWEVVATINETDCPNMPKGQETRSDFWITQKGAACEVSLENPATTSAPDAAGVPSNTPLGVHTNFDFESKVCNAGGNEVAMEGVATITFDNSDCVMEQTTFARLTLGENDKFTGNYRRETTYTGNCSAVFPSETSSQNCYASGSVTDSSRIVGGVGVTSDASPGEFDTPLSEADVERLEQATQRDGGAVLSAPAGALTPDQVEQTQNTLPPAGANTGAGGAAAGSGIPIIPAGAISPIPAGGLPPIPRP